MAVLKNPESEDVKEMAKWEQFPSEWTIGGLRPGNPYKFREFPKMMYRAQRIPGNGKWATSMPAPAYFGFRDENEWGRACEAAEQFGRGCRKVVGNEEERKRAVESGEGWCDSPQAAVEWAENLDKMIGNEAAERNYRDRNMSEKALAESAAAEAEHFPHLPNVPEKPIKRKPGRPSKNAAA